MINGMTATLSDHAIYLELLCRGGRIWTGGLFVPKPSSRGS